MGTRLVALLLGLAGPPDHLADLPAEAEVVVDDLDVFDEPDEALDRLRAISGGETGSPSATPIARAG